MPMLPDAPLLALAQGYPNRPVKMIIPFAPGGASDFVGRILQPRLSELLGTQIVVENRPGASGNIGMDAAARATPDGYTIVLNTIPLVTNKSLFDKLSWDPIRDFAPIGMLATAPHVLVVPPKLPAKNVQDLVKLARASPGKLNYASAGIGTTFHFCAEMFKEATGTYILHVPYRGGGPALLDTVAGQVDLSFPTLSAALPHVKAGALRALGVTSGARSLQLPDVPTLREAGVRNFEFTQWLALLAPAATPQPIVARLNGALNAALKSREVQEKFAQQGFDAFATTPAEAGKFLAAEVERYASLIKTRGIRPE